VPSAEPAVRGPCGGLLHHKPGHHRGREDNNNGSTTECALLPCKICTSRAS
jgi:hypothetical protein